eukprot:TRINITY_DN34174_c0_g1_i1.p1 TRINITY_DN34174_c0_g1~~TRINITY_DN34174_c0_g1_i1.p1  ORF type:complete len:508 (+),score=118.94 TRINITY_DN34174_c0_g1_i1:106-1629(+)
MDEKYQRIKVLGKGSFGKAYLVHNTEANEKCVVKQMETMMMDPKERGEAVKEALLLKRMNHPNIVRFQEVFMTRKGRLCIVMDYADGGDVHQEIKRQEGNLLPESRILEWFVQTGFALRHVHGRKVLHRDLKTQNIFLMATGQVKLGDFGIAKVLDATKDYAKTMVGTPYYLSPEIIEDKPYNFKSDIWSCGVVLYEMTTLKHPFNAESLVILAGKILKDQYPPPDEGYSPELQSLIKSLLCKDASKRPLITEILAIPFLQDSMRSANDSYRLQQDLSEFAAAAARAVAAAKAADAPGAGQVRLSPAPLSSPVGGACSSASQPSPSQQAEAADSVLMGTSTVSPITRNGSPAEAEEVEEDLEGKNDDDYEEEEFEDYSGSEDGDKKPVSELQQSVAKLKLGAGAKERTTESSSSAAATPGKFAAGSPAEGSNIRTKADSLRTYLLAQLPRAHFDRAYACVRSSAKGDVDAEDLRQQVSDAIGADKAPELFTLFQLLCFLEDVSAGGA